MNKLTLTCIILLLLLITLVLLDIITGIWYFNRQNIVFSSTEFNNIVTPIASILTLFGIGVGAYFATRQNRIALSGILKPNFDERVNKLFKAMQDFKLPKKTGLVGISLNKDYSGLEYITAVRALLAELANNDEFQEDMKNCNDEGKMKDYQYYSKRSYFNHNHLLNRVISDIDWVYSSQKLKNLILDIKSSQLLVEDQNHLYRKIQDDVLSNYITFIGAARKFPLFETNYLVVNSLVQYEFKNVEHSSFSELYDWIQSEVGVIR